MKYVIFVIMLGLGGVVAIFYEDTTFIEGATYMLIGGIWLRLNEDT